MNYSLRHPYSTSAPISIPQPALTLNRRETAYAETPGTTSEVLAKVIAGEASGYGHAAGEAAPSVLKRKVTQQPLPDQEKTKTVGKSQLIVEEKETIIELPPFIQKDNTKIAAKEKYSFSGKAKLIYEIPGDNTHVLYYPVSKDKQNEIIEEKKTMDAMRSAIEKEGGSIENLLLEAEEVKSTCGNLFTLKVRKARCDLEQFISDSTKHPESFDIGVRMKLASDLLQGLSALHRAGFLYGDMKPDNCLIFDDGKGGFTLKIADFGKCSRANQGLSLSTHSGNTRFAPLENLSSQALDVFGCGMVLIRIFEELVCDGNGNPLLDIKDEKLVKTAEETKKRGIERFVILHKDFPGTEQNSTRGKITRVKNAFTKVAVASSKDEANLNAIMHEYVGALFGALGAVHGGQGRGEIKNLGTIILNMMNFDKENRFSMEDALFFFKECSDRFTKDLNENESITELSDKLIASCFDSDSLPTAEEFNQIAYDLQYTDHWLPIFKEKCQKIDPEQMGKFLEKLIVSENVEKYDPQIMNALLPEQPEALKFSESILSTSWKERPEDALVNKRLAAYTPKERVLWEIKKIKISSEAKERFLKEYAAGLMNCLAEDRAGYIEQLKQILNWQIALERYIRSMPYDELSKKLKQDYKDCDPEVLVVMHEAMKYQMFFRLTPSKLKDFETEIGEFFFDACLNS